MKSFNFILAMAALCSPTSTMSQSALVAGHFGNSDPVAEGFTPLLAGTPQCIPIAGDLGLDAWSLRAGSDEDIAFYRKKLSLQAVSALASGWTLSLTLRVLSPVGSTEGNMASLSTSKEAFVLGFGRQSDGDPILQFGNSVFTFENTGPGYHTYQLVFDAERQVVDLWFDGAVFAAGLSGAPNPSAAQLAWGIGQHPPGIIAVSHWNEVSLSVVPEPSSLIMLVLGGGLLWAGRCRRMRRRSQPNETCETMD